LSGHAHCGRRRHDEALSTGRLSEPSVLYDNVSIGQTVTQMPQPMHDEVALSIGSCLNAYCMTSMIACDRPLFA